MIGIDETLMFQPLKFAVLTISDTRTLLDDRSGACLSERIIEAGNELTVRAIVKDEAADISDQIEHWSARVDVDVIITTGGTGLTGRDVTIEAVSPLFDKVMEGFSVLFHRLSFEKVGLSTLQSRACAGVKNGTFIFCLPGSTNAVAQIWDEILHDALDSRYRPSSMVDLIPRLKE